MSLPILSRSSPSGVVSLVWMVSVNTQWEREEALLELVAYAKPFMRDEWQEQALTRARAALESK